MLYMLTGIFLYLTHISSGRRGHGLRRAGLADDAARADEHAGVDPRLGDLLRSTSRRSA
jgi:hypothetical protein